MIVFDYVSIFCEFGIFRTISFVFLSCLVASQSFSASAALLRSTLSLPVLSFASLQSWSSLLRIFYSVSALLMRSHSLLVLLLTVTLCGCLLLFLPLLVSASHCRCFSRGPPLLFDVFFCFSAILLWCSSLHLGSLCLAICSLIYGALVFFSWLWRVCSSLFARCHWCLLPCSLCGVLVSAVLLPRSDLRFPSRCGSLWDESGFDVSYVSLGFLVSIPCWTPFGSSLRSFLL